MNLEYILLVAGMGIVTYIPRWIPLIFLTNRTLPRWFTEWLDFMPAAILSALIFPMLLTAGEPRRVDLLRPELIAAVPTLLLAIKTRSLAGTVIVGMMMYWGIHAIMH